MTTSAPPRPGSPRSRCAVAVVVAVDLAEERAEIEVGVGFDAHAGRGVGERVGAVGERGAHRLAAADGGAAVEARAHERR